MNGISVTFVIDDADITYKKTLEMGVPAVQELRNEFFEQRRFFAPDPGGCLIDMYLPWESE